MQIFSLSLSLFLNNLFISLDSFLWWSQQMFFFSLLDLFPLFLLRNPSNAWYQPSRWMQIWMKHFSFFPKMTDCIELIPFELIQLAPIPFEPIQWV